MSLKGFHIVFVTVSTLLCVFLGMWAVLWAKDATGLTIAIGTLGAAGAVLMPVYGVCFYRKISRIHI
jgi:hypothetical protein